MPAVSAVNVRSVQLCSSRRRFGVTVLLYQSHLSSHRTRYHAAQSVEAPGLHRYVSDGAAAWATPASASVAATASSSRFTAAASATRGWPRTAASRLPSTARAGPLRRAARGAMVSPRRPARRGGMSRLAATGSGPPALAGLRDATRRSRDEPASSSAQPSASGSPASAWWTASLPGRPAAELLAGACGATCTGWPGRGLLWRREFVACGAGSGLTAGACGAASGCGSTAEACSRKAEENERNRQNWHKEAKGGENGRRPVAQERGSLRLQARHPP